MKRDYPYPDRSKYNRSVSKIPSNMALNDFEYSLWEYGFNCAIRLMKLRYNENKNSKRNTSMDS